MLLQPLSNQLLLVVMLMIIVIICNIINAVLCYLVSMFQKY